MSIHLSHYPSSFKHAIVCPLLKKHHLDPSSASSYRPISNLPTISKLFERLILRQVSNYISSNSMFPPFQSAYRPQHSTMTACTKLSNDLLLALDKHLVSLVISLDLSSAFDVVDHTILLSCLRQRYCFSSHVISWFKSYLSNRSYHVVSNSNSSAPVPLSCGVPQGSVLGPLLFTLLLGDLSSIVVPFGFEVIQYADDIVIYASCTLTSASNLASDASSCLSAIHAYLCSIRMFLNNEKSNMMWITPRHSYTLDFPVCIHNFRLPEVTIMTILGVPFDNNLSFLPFIRSKISSCSLILRDIRSVRRNLDVKSTAILISSLFMPRLEYCLGLLVNCPAYQFHYLQRILHTAARVIFRLRKYDHISNTLRILNWLDIPSRITSQILTLAWQIKFRHNPPYLYLPDSASYMTTGLSLRSHRSYSLFVPRHNGNHGYRAFTIAAPRLWNKLPRDTKSLTSLKHFKTSLIAILLANELK